MTWKTSLSFILGFCFSLALVLTPSSAQEASECPPCVCPPCPRCILEEPEDPCLDDFGMLCAKRVEVEPSPQPDIEAVKKALDLIEQADKVEEQMAEQVAK